MRKNKTIKSIRNKLKLTQTEFSKLFDITQVYLCYLERGMRRPSSKLAIKIKDFANKVGMDISLEDIILR